MLEAKSRFQWKEERICDYTNFQMVELVLEQRMT